MKNLPNHLQRTIKLDHFDAGNSRFFSFIVEDKAHPRNFWKVIKTFRILKLKTPPHMSADILRTIDPE